MPTRPRPTTAAVQRGFTAVVPMVMPILTGLPVEHAVTASPVPPAGSLLAPPPFRSRPTGAYGPLPKDLRRAAAIPCVLTSASTTAAARSCESFMFGSRAPTLSVWPDDVQIEAFLPSSEAWRSRRSIFGFRLEDGFPCVEEIPYTATCPVFVRSSQNASAVHDVLLHRLLFDDDQRVFPCEIGSRRRSRFPSLLGQTQRLRPVPLETTVASSFLAAFS